MGHAPVMLTVPEPAPSAQRSRLDSVDLLRGIVMVVMALDHVRNFFGTSGWDPDFATASAPTYVTRWISHAAPGSDLQQKYCAGLGKAPPSGPRLPARSPKDPENV